MFQNGVAVISCSDLTNDEIIKNILGSELPEAVQFFDKIHAYVWHTETKYYAADINLVSLKEKDLISEEFANNIEAIIVHIDSKKDCSLNDVQCWLPFIEKFAPDVQLLACNNCSDDKKDAGLTRHELLDWCLKNQFELVELHPIEDNLDPDVEDDFKETKGYKRVIQALHAHTWSDMALKEPPVYQPSEEILSSLREDEQQNGFVEGATNSSSESDKIPTEEAKMEKIDKLFKEDQDLFDAVGQEDPGGESFENFFSKILNMREKASTLVGEERKLYAEKVAIEFWKAIGGDEEEIAGLSSDEN